MDTGGVRNSPEDERSWEGGREELSTGPRRLEAGGLRGGSTSGP